MSDILSWKIQASSCLSKLGPSEFVFSCKKIGLCFIHFFQQLFVKMYHIPNNTASEKQEISRRQMYQNLLLVKQQLEDRINSPAFSAGT